MKCGIYKITNLINGKSYVGQSIDINRRFRNHRCVAFSENNHKYSYPLSQAFRKYGLENFSFQILEECPDDLLNEREHHYYSLYQPEYCLSSPYEHFSKSKESRRKISESLTGRKLSVEQVEGMKKAFFGKNNKRSKRTIAINIKTGAVLEFESLRDAANNMIKMGLSKGKVESVRNNIWRACSGNRKSAFGFIWHQEDY